MPIAPLTSRLVADVVRRETAMVYGTGKEHLIEAALLPLAGARGCRDVDDYVARYLTDPVERTLILDSLTINETSWFRDSVPFKALSEVILPRMIADRARGKRLRIWSAACSSGQEVYSIAMLCRELLPADWQVEILATDVSTAMLKRVDDGRFSQVEMNRGLPATSLVRWFERTGATWRVHRDLRSMVRTQHLNLAAPFPVLPCFDIVFLRNVLPCFDVKTQQDVLQRLRPTVADDGWLVLGSAETAVDAAHHWSRESVGRAQVFRPITNPKDTQVAHLTSHLPLTGALAWKS